MAGTLKKAIKKRKAEQLEDYRIPDRHTQPDLYGEDDVENAHMRLDEEAGGHYSGKGATDEQLEKAARNQWVQTNNNFLRERASGEEHDLEKQQQFLEDSRKTYEIRSRMKKFQKKDKK